MKKTTIKLKKVVGQIMALAEMIEKDENCDKLITQFKAAKGALNGAFNDVLEDSLKSCLKDKKGKDLDNIIKQVSRR